LLHVAVALGPTVGSITSDLRENILLESAMGIRGAGFKDRALVEEVFGDLLVNTG